MSEKCRYCGNKIDIAVEEYYCVCSDCENDSHDISGFANILDRAREEREKLKAENERLREENEKLKMNPFNMKIEDRSHLVDSEVLGNIHEGIK